MKMTQVKIARTGHEISAICKCGMEKFPIRLLPGVTTVHCTRNRDIINSYQVYLNEYVEPIIKSV